MSPIFSRHPRGELSAYVDAQVTDSRRQAIETHLASCDSCRLEVDDLLEVRTTLAALPEVDAPRSFAITTEMVAKPAAPPTERAAPSFASGLRMASAAIGVALVAVVLADAGNFSATDNDDAGSGVAEVNLVEPQASEFRATGADPAAAGDSEDSDVSESAVGGTAPSEDGGDDSAEPEFAAAPVASEAPSDEIVDESSARSTETEREPLFPGTAPPRNYAYSAGASSADEGIGGFAPGSGPSSSSGDDAEAAPEATDIGAPTAEEAAPVPQATPGEDALAEEMAENDNGGDGSEVPDAAGESEAQPLAADDDSGGLSTLNIIEIVLGIGLTLALIGGFVLPRLRRTAG